MKRRNQSETLVRVLCLFVGACVASALVGCVTTGTGTDSMSSDQALFDFVASFARNALAAFLF